MFLPIPVALGNIKAGTLRALAIASARRTSLLPDLPTVAESGVPGFEVALRYGLAVPAGTPPAIIARLNKELNAALAAEDVKARLATEGAEALPGTPEAYAADIAGEEKKWGGLVKNWSEGRASCVLRITPASGPWPELYFSHPRLGIPAELHR